MTGSSRKATRQRRARHRSKRSKRPYSGKPAPRFDSDSIEPAAAKPPMRVLLRNAKTMKFLQAGERWTKDPKRAMDFHSGWGATVHAFTMNPRHLEILYEFDDDRYDLHIPVLRNSRR